MVELPAYFHDNRLGTPSGLYSEIGTLLPMVPCGRTALQSLRQAFIGSRASASVRKQCAFRHSARKRPLNVSINALFVG